MGRDTGISWCDHTFNPWWGCTKVSAGCAHCYAETLANRYSPGLWGGTKRRTFGAKQPLAWNAAALRAGVRRRVLCGSMCDVFDADGIGLEHERRGLWQLIDDTPNLDYLLLTKRAENMAEMLPKPMPRNIWLGVSVENQAMAQSRIPILLNQPASVHFVSAEPLLEQICFSANCCGVTMNRYVDHRIRVDGARVDWVIVGGESGPGYRPMKIEWLEYIVEQCQCAGTPVFVKQDSGPRPGMQGRIPDELWALKQFPTLEGRP